MCWYRFPISAQKSHTGPHRVEFWFQRLFFGMLWVWQGGQVPLQLVIYRLLDGADGKSQGTITHLTRLSTYLSGFHIDELFLLQLANVFGHRVGTHAGVLADFPNAGPALVGFPVLAEHQVGVDRQLAWGQSQGEDLVGQKKKSSQWAAVGVSVLKFRGVPSPMIF